MSKKRWCEFHKKLCKHCSENDLSCNEIEREGISYLDCRFAKKPNGEFKKVITCGICGSNDVDEEIITYYKDGCSRIDYKCNCCENKSE